MAKGASPPIQQRVIDGLQGLSNTERDQIIRSLAKLTKMPDVQDLDVA